MPNRSPYGNLTAALVVIALLELLADRLLGRLFVSPGCRSGVGCLWLRVGPFLLHLTGLLTLMVGAGGIAGHIKRGELFPRGVRLTVAALSAVFFLLVALSLVFGRMPERYHIPLETGFGFVVALLGLSFVGARTASTRTRLGFVLFVLPPLLHIVALLAARKGWWSRGAISPERITFAGELTLLVAAATAPLLFLSRSVPRARIVAGLALAAGISAFFFVAFVGRTDLVQTVALYSVYLELPRALSLLGVLYVVALFGFVATVAVLLLSPGPSRLAGLGMCLVGLGGYQTSSPVALAVSLCGLVALATGTLRMGGGDLVYDGSGRLSATDWRALLGTIAAAIAEPPTAGAEPVLIEVVSGGGDTGTDIDADTASVRAARRGRPIALVIRRIQGVVRRLDASVGVPGDEPPDATIESHETWIGRRPEDRTTLPRTKTGDQTFDRKLGVYGRAPMQDRGVRRKVLRFGDGSITLWAGRAARFVVPGDSAEDRRGHAAWPTIPTSARALADLVDTLVDLVDASESPVPASGAE